MTDIEFKNWFNRCFRAAFRAVDSWLAKLPTDSDRGDSEAVTQGDVMRSWRNALRDVTQSEAESVVAEIQRGDIEEPRAFDGFPRTIRAAAKKNRVPVGREKYINGVRVFSCQKCQDEGTLIVADPKDAWAFLHGEPYRPGRAAQCRVACDCGTAKQRKWAINGRQIEVPDYDPDKMIRLEGNESAAEWEAACSLWWEENHRIEKRANYSPALAQFNN